MKAYAKSMSQKGFTLIELIITIVIIGVLAAVAIPKFQSLSTDAEKGVAAGIAAAVASATSVNYAKSKIPGAVAGTTYFTLNTCGDINTNLAALADVPAGYSVGPAATVLSNTGVATAGCIVSAPAPSTATAPFNAYGA